MLIGPFCFVFVVDHVSILICMLFNYEKKTILKLESIEFIYIKKRKVYILFTTHDLFFLVITILNTFIEHLKKNLKKFKLTIFIYIYSFNVQVARSRRRSLSVQLTSQPNSLCAFRVVFVFVQYSVQ